MTSRTRSKHSSHTLENLRKVLAVNRKINSTLNIDELLGIIMTTAAEVMRAETASLMLVDEKAKELVFRVALGEKGNDLIEKFRLKMGEGIAGYVAETGKSLIVNDTLKDKRFARRVDQATGFSSQAILCVPMKAKGKIIGILEAINPLGRKGFLRQDLDLFQIFADQATISLENARLHSELVQQEKAKQELKIARQIQQNFLPALDNMTLGIDVSAKNISAREVGGDFYDVIQLDNTKIGIVMGDVSGKGVPAALYMVRAISDYRYLAPHEPSPAKLLNALNQSLVKDSALGMFITLFYIVIDKNKKELSYASAGHHPLLRSNCHSGAMEWFKDASGMPLGLFTEAVYTENKIQIKSGDVFCLYTDGITEARNKSGQEYETDRLKQSVMIKKSSAKAYSDHILDDVEAFTRGAEQHDDMTILTLMIHD